MMILRRLSQTHLMLALIAAWLVVSACQADYALESADSSIALKTVDPANAPFASDSESGFFFQDISNGDAAKAGENESTTTWKRASAQPNASKLMIGDTESLPLVGVQSSVRIEGYRARVLFDYYYFCNKGNQLEGTFKLRLPDGATPWYLAFGDTKLQRGDPADLNLANARQRVSDLVLPEESAKDSVLSEDEMRSLREGSWGNVKEARVVERETAALAYTQTARRRVDPALLEWAGAGVFNARVFPLFQNRIHRIVFGYDVDLLNAGGDLLYQLGLPEEDVHKSIDVTVADAPRENLATAPKQNAGIASIELTGSADATERSDWHARLEGKKLKRIDLRIKQASNPLLYGNQGGTNYFTARKRLPSESAKSDQAHSGVFLLDTSLSARPDAFNVWLRILEETLTKNRDVMKHFNVMLFSIDQRWHSDAWLANTEENVNALMEELNQLALEGATDIRSALHAAGSGTPAMRESESAKLPTHFFLLSDGGISWGEHSLDTILAELSYPSEDQSTLSSDSRVFCYNTGLMGVDRRVLAGIARATKGAVFTVLNESHVAQAASAYRTQPIEIVSISAKDAGDILIAGNPSHLYPGQEISVVGRGMPGVVDGAAQITLKLSRSGETQDFPLRFDRAMQSRLAARTYGAAAVELLEAQLPSTRTVATSYARYFRVPGSTCSLVMLESEWDYQRYGIKAEEDGVVVGFRPAANEIANAVARRKEHESDRKARLLHQIERMQSIQGSNFKPSNALLLSIRELTDADLQIVQEPVARTETQADQLSKQYRDAITANPVDVPALLDALAERKREVGDGDALMAISSLLEANPNDELILQDAAFTAMELGYYGHAFHLFHQAARMRPWNAQLYHRMAQALSMSGNAPYALVMFEVGKDMQGGITQQRREVRRNERKVGMKDVFEMEYLSFLRTSLRDQRLGALTRLGELRRDELQRAVYTPRADLIVSIAWNTDETDVDLYVKEPSGLECFYRNPIIQGGGEMSTDVRNGYGPEMYILKNAKPGTYDIDAHYYRGDDRRTSGRSTVFVALYQNFGTDEEKVTWRTVTLQSAAERLDLFDVTLK